MIQHQASQKYFIFPLSIYNFLIEIRLGIPNLGIDETYQQLLQNYAQDIEMVSRIYKEQRQDPPVGRNLPPVGGRILWAKQLYSKIHSPMALFQQVCEFLEIHFNLLCFEETLRDRKLFLSEHSSQVC